MIISTFKCTRIKIITNAKDAWWSAISEGLNDYGNKRNLEGNFERGFLGMKDSDGKTIKAGDTIVFSYGIPPLRVVAPVVLEDDKLVAITTGHTPSKCELKELKKYIGNFYKKSAVQQ